MRPFSDEHDSGARPVAPEESPEQAPEREPLEDGPEIEPSVPAGAPEAPVGPAVEDPDAGEQSTHEQQLERDLDELAAKAEKADEYLELAKRTRADFENYRKRAAREAAAAQERGVVKLVRELLPAVDNLDRALEAAGAKGESNDELLSGIKLVRAEVIAALNRAGVELYSPGGEQFDPTRHEAVAQQPSEGAEPGTVVEVYQRGCRLGDSVIRPARVVVAG
jgi:molecular chaperone GrpE